MQRLSAVLALALLATLFSSFSPARADDGAGLARSADPRDLTISGVSSGGAMAIQYAVAHSASVMGVGMIAAPGWGCAEGRLSVALKTCMCGLQAPAPQTGAAHKLAAAGAIDSLASGKPLGLKRAYVFHSDADATVVKASAQASIAFLTAFIGTSPFVDSGNAATGSDRAGHGIVSPDGTDSCQRSDNDRTFVRDCHDEDSAGKLLWKLYDPAAAYDASKRVASIAEADIWQFGQQPIIDRIRATDGQVALDRFWPPFRSTPRQNFDMAQTGYLYVPPFCRTSGRQCTVHIALHGCRQDAKTFASTAGYNNWAEHFRIIVVYPALVSAQTGGGESCPPPWLLPPDSSWVKPNPNGCWDWWGYLDNPWPPEKRYLTRKAPQMRVIEGIVQDLTR